MESNRLGNLLLEGNMVREEDLERCLEIQALTGGSRPLGQILVEQNVISAVELNEILQLQEERRAIIPPLVPVQGQGCERFFAAAVAAGATEMILSEGRSTMVRVAGQLRELEEDALDGLEVWQFVRRYMGENALDVLAERRSITQEFHVPHVGRGRIMAFRHCDGACVIVRLQPEHVRSPQEAGLDQNILRCLGAGKGLVLVTGEAGSGITSTMATMLGEIVRKDPQLVLILDETIEYEIPKGNAIVVTRRIGEDSLDYESALSAAIRDDPDVLVVGDVSTPARFDLALRAAEDGRLVIAGLHARSVGAALRRALNFYHSHDVPHIRSTLASVLNCVLRLQLVPDKDAVSQVLATELLVMDRAARAVVRDGSLDRLKLLLNMEGTASGHSMDSSLERLLREDSITFEDSFHLADDKSRLLKRFKDKSAVQEGVKGMRD